LVDNNFIHDSSPQEFYNSYNDFIISHDIKIFNKLVSKFLLVEMTSKVPGDIIELGVFKGSGMVGWLKILKSFGIINKKCIGFDIFDSNELVENISTVDRELMKRLFVDRNFNPDGYGLVLKNKISAIGFNNFDIITGDVFKTIPEYLNNNPGFRASVVNFDLDTAEPTYYCLNSLWERVVVGGVLVFDEYGINEWTESNAVDKFISEMGLKLQRTNYESPSAFIIKE
jgi:hypothetical protein